MGSSHDNAGSAALDIRRKDKGELLAVLRDMGVEPKGGTMRCPFPDEHRNGDKNPSGGVYAGKDGVWRFKCHGCSFCGDCVRRTAASIVSAHQHRKQARQVVNDRALRGCVASFEPGQDSNRALRTIRPQRRRQGSAAGRR